jgi:hypothetical protein
MVDGEEKRKRAHSRFQDSRILLKGREGSFPFCSFPLSGTLHFPALRTYDMMGSLASGSGWEWGQDSGGMKFVQQIGWELDKTGLKNAELEDGEPGG